MGVLHSRALYGGVPVPPWLLEQPERCGGEERAGALAGRSQPCLAAAFGPGVWAEPGGSVEP